MSNHASKQTIRYFAATATGLTVSGGFLSRSDAEACAKARNVSFIKTIVTTTDETVENIKTQRTR